MALQAETEAGEAISLGQQVFTESDSGEKESLAWTNETPLESSRCGEWGSLRGGGKVRQG